MEYTRYTEDKTVLIALLTSDPWDRLIKYHRGHVSMTSTRLGLMGRTPMWLDVFRAYLSVTGGPSTYTYGDQDPGATDAYESLRWWNAGVHVGLGISARVGAATHLSVGPSFTKLFTGAVEEPAIRALRAGVTLEL